MAGKPIARHGAGVPLYEHLKRVGGGVLSYFEDKLTASTGIAKCAVKPIGLGYKSLLAGAVLSGLLHDIGKASDLYQHDSGSFYLHEWVSATITYRASDLLLDRGLEEASNLFYLVSHIVARHHAAMGRRHPSKLSQSDEIRRILDTIAGAISRIDLGVFSELLGDIGMTKKLTGILLESLSTLQNQENSRLKSDVKNTIHALGLLTGGYQSLEEVMGSVACIGTMQAATGALIVSDILAASEEDKSSRRRGYALTWQRELEKIAETHSLGSGISRLPDIISSIEGLLERS